jgi:Hint module
MKVFYGGAKELTTQLYFKDEFLREVGALAQYAERGDPDTTNEDEGVPAALIVEVKGDSRSGYTVEYAVGVNVDAGDAGGAGDAHDARDARDAEQVGRSSGSCFPADAVVVLENGEEKRMADLDVGDRVLVGAGAVSDVFAFTHRTTGTVNEFVTVSLESGESISMTPGHYLHVDGALVAASSVRPGATVRRASGGEGVVSAVRREMLSGLYNPQTLDGDIVVNGVVASTYTTAVKPAVAHRALGALRMSYRLSGRVDLTFGWLENGVGAAGRKALDTVGLRGALVELSNAQNIACKY